MSRCIAVFLDFAYMARRSEHDMVSLGAMQEALEHFYELGTIFIETGVRPNSVGLPRPHALIHYIRAILQVGSPNDLCPTITKSKPN